MTLHRTELLSFPVHAKALMVTLLQLVMRVVRIVSLYRAYTFVSAFCTATVTLHSVLTTMSRHTCVSDTVPQSI